METRPYWAHETSVIDSGADIGEGTKIWHFSHICGNRVKIGMNCSFGQNTYVGNDVTIGTGVRVQNNVSIYDRVILGDYVFCGPSMVFTNVINPRAHVPRKDEFKPTIVHQGVSFGANCTIVCGVTIGEYAFIAAGAVVTKDVPAYALIKGVPGRQDGWICQCGMKLENDDPVVCRHCNSRYEVSNQGIRRNS